MNNFAVIIGMIVSVWIANSYVLKNLMTIGVLSKVHAMTDEKNKKKVSYEITDGMYRFWYRLSRWREQQ
ncbi:MAG: hypothetical protein IKE58_09860 [Blautia sp.]|nr:hypothetical protein [Blautia sp.]